MSRCRDRVSVGGPSVALRKFGRMMSCGVVAGLVALADPAYPQDGAAAAQLEFDVLFQRLLEDPADVETNRRFIEVALALRDYEAAIGALERLLFYAPEDPELQYQIGALYAEIGSYLVAKSYFETVLESPAASADLRLRAAAGIEAADRRLRPSPWSVFAQAGLRYQTNANAEPDEVPVDAPEDAEVATEDWNSFALLAVSYAHPVGPVVLEAAFTGYYADQFEVDRLDLGLAEVNAGPRFPLFSADGAALSVRPYGVLNGILLGDDAYERAVGGGVSVRAEIAALTLEPYVEYRDQEYYNSDDYTTAEELTGHIVTYAGFASVALGENVRWTSRAGLNDNEAAVDSNSYDEYFVDASIRLQFDPFAGDRMLTLVPFAAAYWTNYDAADPDVDAETAREDFEWRTGARFEFAFSDLVGVGAQVQYSVNDSNLADFDYDNLQVTMGPTVRF